MSNLHVRGWTRGQPYAIRHEHETAATPNRNTHDNGAQHAYESGAAGMVRQHPAGAPLTFRPSVLAMSSANASTDRRTTMRNAYDGWRTATIAAQAVIAATLAGGVAAVAAAILGLI